jgi:hypothetical protein
MFLRATSRFRNAKSEMHGLAERLSLSEHMARRTY